MKIKHQNKKPSLIDIGWREWICLSEFNDFHLKAKIDTGATISAIHATHIEEFFHKGSKYVKFRIYQSKNYKMIEKPVIGYKTIKSSFGSVQMRPLVNIIIKMGNSVIHTDITLAKRSRMTYPVLIGRSSLDKNYRINPKRSYLTGKKD